MLAVIFRAEIARLDEDYREMAAELRRRALEDYGCLEFVATTEGDSEIAVSYWESDEHIRRWKADPLHTRAQQLGRDQWYSSYSVEVVNVLRGYAWRGKS
jgi:heme-degrading monooxygenase HmoA